MKIIDSFLWFVATVIFLSMGILLIGFAAHTHGAINLSEQFTYITKLPNLWLVSGLAGLLILIIGISIVKISIGRFQREKTIAFENPEGQVVISLSAIEDFIKRIMKQISEIKDMRCNVKATKRGITISAKLVLWSDANIPDVTEKIQSLIKTRVQEMLGIEESITVSVHITKIAHKEAAKREKAEEEVPPQPAGFKGAIEYKVKGGKKK